MGNQVLQILVEHVENVPREFEENNERYKAMSEACSRYNLTPTRVEIPNPSLPLVVWGTSKKWVESVFNQYKGMHLIFKGNPAVYTEHRACIIGENTAGEIEKILTYLTKANRMKIALLATNRVHFDSMYYVRTFLEKAEEMGIPISEDDVFWDSGENENDPQKPSMPVESYNKFYQVHHRYDAVVCYNTHSAIYFCARAKENGIRVPEDIYLIGRGHLQIANAVNPSITTISRNEEEVGQQIVKLYRYLLSNPYVESANVLLDCRITPRKSTNFFLDEAEMTLTEDAFLKQKQVPSAIYHEIGMIEFMIKNCTKMDIRILDGIRQGLSREKLAVQEFTTLSTVHYRMKRMLRLADVATKEELFALLDKYSIDISTFM